MGLQNIRKMIQADTYEERYALVKLAARNRGPPIRDTLDTARGRHREPLLFPQVLERNEDSVNIEGEVFADGDTGPHDVWRWAFSDVGGELQPRHHHQDIQRAWGHALWDKDRLEASGVFDRLWQAMESVVSGEEQERADLQCLCTAISQKVRKRIYDKGGRGWWDWGDENKLKWKVFGRKNYKYYIGRAFMPTRRPSSLGEAREVWDMVRDVHDELDPTHVESPSLHYPYTDDDDDL